MILQVHKTHLPEVQWQFFAVFFFHTPMCPGFWQLRHLKKHNDMKLQQQHDGNLTLDIQIPGLNPQTSPEKAFQGSKHLLTKYLDDFGCLG